MRDRDDAHAPLARRRAHVLLAVDDGAFVSLLDPPRRPRRPSPGAPATAPSRCSSATTAAATSCCRRRSSSTTTPQVAPESDGDMFDATEIDEILALRVLTLTDEEKAEAAGHRRPRRPRSSTAATTCRPRCGSACTAPSARWAVGPMPDADAPTVARAVVGPGRRRRGRPVRPTPLLVGGVEVAAGTAVRLRPSRRADAHDLFLAGLAGDRRRGVPRRRRRACTSPSPLDDDPATEAMLGGTAATCYFHPDEIEPLPMSGCACARRRHRQHLPRRRRLRRRGRQPAVAGAALPDGVRVEDFGIRGVHLAYELLDGYDALVLVDALPMGERAGHGRRARGRSADADDRATTPAVLDAHSHEPGRRARAARRPRRQPSTGCVVVGCQPAMLDDGIGLSPPVAARSTGGDRRRRSTARRAVRRPRAHGHGGDLPMIRSCVVSLALARSPAW